jgi:hypothetical protein
MELLINWNFLAGASPINEILKLIDLDFPILLPFFILLVLYQISFLFKKEK